MANYRPNVAALVTNYKGRLLVCERIDSQGAWQFPQGGVDEGEELETALKREVEEEIGVRAKHYKILSSRGGYRYEYGSGPKVKKGVSYEGQEQTYYLCQLEKGAPDPDVEQPGQEFANWKWIEPEDFQLDWLPEFRVAVYRQVLRDFFGVELCEKASLG